MLHVHGYGHEMEGRRRRSYARFHPSQAAEGWKGHLYLPASRPCRGARCGLSGLDASILHAVFLQVSALQRVLSPSFSPSLSTRHMVDASVSVVLRTGNKKISEKNHEKLHSINKWMTHPCTNALVNLG
jgi:hypothetical protein